jgi:hypothetical protein
MKRVLLVPVFVALTVTAAPSQQPAPSVDALIARAKSLELDTPYEAPPGDALDHHTSGFAKIMCSAVFISGLAPEFAAENVGYFTSPYAERAKVGKPVIDRANQAVHIKLPNGVTRTAKYLGSQGCVTLPVGKTSVSFTPVSVKSGLPDPSTQQWPMGDVLPEESLPPKIDAAKLKQAVNAAFEPAEGMTAAFVVTWRGRLIAERYGDGVTARTPLEGWSMGKSLTATMLGIFACRAGCGSKPPRTRIMIRQVRIRITCTCTPAASIPFTTRRRGRCSGLLARSDATTTPIPCWPTI